MITRTTIVLGGIGVLIVLGAAVGLAAVIGVNTGSFYYEDSTVGDDKIAAKVGDRNYRDFHRNFVRTGGQSPRAFRHFSRRHL